jgi:DNA invertase Pin-like site-specific DNA recombinase
MVDFVSNSNHPVDAILVHSFSRFFRDSYAFEHYRRRFKRNGVSVISLTQDVTDDPQGDLVRSILTSFDAYASAENAKHVLRSMRENTRQGFWNGAKPPFGYCTVDAGKRGDKIKKQLAIDPDESEKVKLIFQLYTEGDGVHGPMGVKAIVNYLNYRGISLRGKNFHVSNVHDILTREAYIGKHYFNRTDSKTFQQKPHDQWEALSVSPIITEEAFNQVQSILKAKNPKKTPPRVVNGPTLLTGLLRCSSCGGGMTLRTGKSGRYRYYTCSTCARMGKSACLGRSVRMDMVDNLVIENIADQILIPERLQTILAELIDRSEASEESRKEKLAKLRYEHGKQETALANLYIAIESGAVDLGDRQLRDRIALVKARRDELAEETDLLTRQINNTNRAITPEKLEIFSKAMREKLLGEDMAFRRAYIHLLVDNIEIDDREIRIRGSKSALAKGIGNPLPEGNTVVPSFVRKWRPQGDSNPCYRRERGITSIHICPYAHSDYI